jgi:hypothetical protein
MSAEMVVRCAVLDALRGHGALMAVLNGVHDGAPVQASAPYAVVGEAIGAEWGTKDVAGWEVRVGLSLFDRAEGSGRLGEMMALADAAVRGIGGVASWEVGSIVFLRSRTVRRSAAERDGGGWNATMDYRLRVLRGD